MDHTAIRLHRSAITRRCCLLRSLVLIVRCVLCVVAYDVTCYIALRSGSIYMLSLFCMVGVTKKLSTSDFNPIANLSFIVCLCRSLHVICYADQRNSEERKRERFSS